ncbi:MAG: Dna2/Cas4 domain-containing protein, partial [Candidatus Thermoplasmatota archaeon]|nr:Dna2/Cas4 domain-containing protein [Candidatus Thermoplasmatota archaeon]
FSHILQLSAYCFLVEEAYKRIPPYGIIRYGQTEFQIEYTPEMKQMVIEKANEMREKLVTGDVHRNHGRESKCRYCSRRSVCPERLA